MIIWDQVYAILYRRVLIHKRTKMAFSNMVLPSILFCIIAILIEFAIKPQDDLDPQASSFNNYRRTNPSYAIVYHPSLNSNLLVQQIDNVTSELIKQDIGVLPTRYQFDNLTQMNSYVYNKMSNSTDNNINMIIGFEIGENLTESYLPITVIYNDTTFDGNPGLVTSFEQLHRVIWRATGHGNFTVRSVNLISKLITQITGRLTPFYILIGLFTLCNFFGRQVIEDIRKEKRPYMETCKISLINYWIGCFIADFILWALISGLSWCILFFAGSIAFKEQPIASLFGFFFGGISIIILTYSWSFLFMEPETGASYLMLLLIKSMRYIFYG